MLRSYHAPNLDGLLSRLSSLSTSRSRRTFEASSGASEMERTNDVNIAITIVIERKRRTRP